MWVRTWRVQTCLELGAKPPATHLWSSGNLGINADYVSMGKCLLLGLWCKNSTLKLNQTLVVLTLPRVHVVFLVKSSYFIWKPVFCLLKKSHWHMLGTCWLNIQIWKSYSTNINFNCLHNLPLRWRWHHKKALFPLLGIDNGLQYKKFIWIVASASRRQKWQILIIVHVDSLKTTDYCKGANFVILFEASKQHWQWREIKK